MRQIRSTGVGTPGVRSKGSVHRLAAAALLVGGLLAMNGGGTSPARAQTLTYEQLNPVQKRIVSPRLAEAIGRRPAAPLAVARAATTAAGPQDTTALGPAIRVNQGGLNDTDTDLQGRGQAQNEPWIAIDPHDSRRVVASYHDYRRGDADCGVSYSSDGGRHWQDSVIPDQFVRGKAYGGKARQFFQAGGDPSVTWDSRGNAYYTCGMFNRGAGLTPSTDQSTGIYVYRSTGTGGATWNFAGKPVVEQPDLAGAGLDEADRQLITADSNAHSPYRDRIYVTWTKIAQDGTAYILAAHSTDYGQTFSDPVVVSKDSSLCAYTAKAPTPAGRCNENQGSQPFVGPDGTLYVVYNNYNTPVDTAENRFQVLLSRSTDGGKSFTPPVKAGDFYDVPDCMAYQQQNPDNGCIPEKGTTTNSVFRAANYPQAAVDPLDPGHVVVTFGSYINRHSNEHTGCSPQGFDPPGADRDTYGPLYSGVKNGTCNNDIVIATSTDYGATFDGGATDVRRLPVATQDAQQGSSDQFFQGMSFTPHGVLVIAYYDRRYGDDERTGYSDITLTTMSQLAVSRTRTQAPKDGHTTHIRVTTSSMPPPTQMSPPYFGDIIRVQATDTVALPVWVDTRRAALFLCDGTAVPGSPPKLCTGAAPPPLTLKTANDQDILTSRVPLR